MAQRVQNVDDVTGEVIVGEFNPTVLTLHDERESFSVELDLADPTFKKLLGALKAYREAGRTVATVRASKSSTKSTSNAGAVREWARANGHEVSDRGAIPQDVRSAYAAAHPVAENEPSTDNDE